MLLLFEAKDSGYVFDAYTHCLWPAASSDATVADPSGRSFLFSLANATGRAGRFSLRDAASAIQLDGSDVSFGAYIPDSNGDAQAHPNFQLFRCGRAADQPGGNYAHLTYASSAYQPDEPASEVDSACAFFGRPDPEFFTAKEIEVYEV